MQQWATILSAATSATSSFCFMGLLGHQVSQRYFWNREARDRYDKPRDPLLYYTEKGVNLLAVQGFEPPEPLVLPLNWEFRQPWQRERRWIAWVAPGTVSALAAGTLGLQLESAPPPRTVIVLEEWTERAPKPPKMPRSGPKLPVSGLFSTSQNPAFG
jgi:hypothetical protein